MYEEYGNIRFFYEQYLRESKKREKQRGLMRAMKGDDQPESSEAQVGFFQRLLRIINVRNQQLVQAVTDVQCAPAN